MENNSEIEVDQYWLLKNGTVALATEHVESGGCWLINGVDADGNVIDGNGVGDEHFKKQIDANVAKATAMISLEKKAIKLLKL